MQRAKAVFSSKTPPSFFLTVISAEQDIAYAVARVTDFYLTGELL